MRVIRVLEVIKAVYVTNNSQAAEHVLGSVLCAPGCFSVYRCSALRKILPKYASSVERAFDFLIKDMGEDRWLCTLMVIFILLFFIKNRHFIHLISVRIHNRTG